MPISFVSIVVAEGSGFIVSVSGHIAELSTFIA